MTSPKRTTVAKTVTPPADVVATVPDPAADPFVPEFSGPTMTENERTELDNYRKQDAARREADAQRAQFMSEPESEEVFVPAKSKMERETAEPPCPIHYPLGWDGVDEAHDSVGCEHGHFPRARQADRAQRIAQMSTPSGQVFDDPWAYGQDI